MNHAYCADQSWQAGEQLFGTVSTVMTWFLLEYNGRWERKAFESSNIPDPVKERLNHHLNTIPGSRLQLLRQFPRLAPDGIAFYIGLARETDPVLYAFHLESYDDLLTLDIPAIVAGDERYKPSLRGDPLFLICTNGRRDLCCAAYGQPVYTALSKIVGASVWQTNHVGGHRFAANLLAFPHGIFNGRVRPDNLVPLVNAYQNGQLYPDTYRGRACYSKPIQVAEYFLRTETGITDLEVFRWLDTLPEESDRWRVRFVSADDQTIHALTIVQFESDFAIYESCGDDEARHVPQYRLLDYAVETAFYG